ncbi:MAG TPA: DUF3619 family protein [Burkholderiaceae bacterium]|nr:DUF3619 family protein [Burkholderiaceae bacterium]
MNQNRFNPPAASHAALEALQSRFAYRVAARLSAGSAELSPEIGERLRFARERALERARAVRAAQSRPVVGVSRGGAAVLGAAGSGWWLRFASVLPVLALAAGLFMIQRMQENAQIATAAEVDAALLADDLPPSAYSDAGFAEFLKTPGE